MRKFIHKVKQHLEHTEPETHDAAFVGALESGPASRWGPFPNDNDWYRYRKQRGVNLGSWFVLERWISDSPFHGAASPAQSDLDIATGAHARETLEHHWDTWITDADWAWLAEKGINTVRIPIGYYHICGADPSVLDGTDFANLAPIFAGAWARVTNALASAHRSGIGVLFDLHAAPGKQNADAHSGTSAPHPAFFAHPENMARTTHILAAFVAHLTAFARAHDPPLPNLVGVELLNEPQPGGHGAALKAWYRDVFRAVHAIDPGLPLYVGDAWCTDEYAGFLKAELEGGSARFVVLDHHLYRCFTSEDTAAPASEHARRLRERGEGTPQMFARVAGELEGAGGALVVGEWSAALNPGSLHGAGDERAAKREFVEAQLGLYARHCAGWFFWTYKKESGGDTGWSFRDAVDAGVFPVESFRRHAVGGVTDVGESESRRDLARDGALGEHSGYWQQFPGNYEHWRFAEGFTRGWDDAYLFASLAPLGGTYIEEIGFVGPWKKRRVSEHAAEKGGSNLWEFEHGFAQGLRAGDADLAAAVSR